MGAIGVVESDRIDQPQFQYRAGGNGDLGAGWVPVTRKNSFI